MSPVKRSMRKIILALLFVILFCALYLVAGVMISYRRQPAVSQEYKDRFRVADCYSDSPSCDRACILEDNTDALMQRLRMVDRARERVILSTFEFRSDKSGKDMLAALLVAAERGVSVKVIADGMPALMQMERNEYFHALASLENVEIKIYNRLNFLMPWKLMGRLHDKYLIADDDVYVLGGRNTYDFFLGDNGYKNYDRDVLVYSNDPGSKESSIHQLEKYFESIWELDANTTMKARDTEEVAAAREELEERYERIKKEYPIFAEEADYGKMTFAVNKITLLANPTHVYAKEPTLFYSMAEIMKHSGSGNITIHTPYIICNEWMYDSFREICESHPDTVLMTNSAGNNGNPFGASDYLLHKGRLVDTGLQIYEYEGGVSYHGKSISIGDRMSIVGSFNMDMRSVYLDTELMLAIDSEGVNRQLREHMEKYEETTVKVLDAEHYEVPDNVTRQDFSEDNRWKVKVLKLKLFNYFRFLM